MKTIFEVDELGIPTATPTRMGAVLRQILFEGHKKIAGL